MCEYTISQRNLAPLSVRLLTYRPYFWPCFRKQLNFFRPKFLSAAQNSLIAIPQSDLSVVSSSMHLQSHCRSPRTARLYTANKLRTRCNICQTSSLKGLTDLLFMVVLWVIEERPFYFTLLPRPRQGDGYCFQAISLFLCQQHYEKTAGPICMKFSGKVWSDHGTT